MNITITTRLPIVQGDLPARPLVEFNTDKPSEWDNADDIKQWGREFATLLNSNVPGTFVDGMIEELKKTYDV